MLESKGQTRLNSAAESTCLSAGSLVMASGRGGLRDSATRPRTTSIARALTSSCLPARLGTALTPPHPLSRPGEAGKETKPVNLVSPQAGAARAVSSVAKAIGTPRFPARGFRFGMDAEPALSRPTKGGAFRK